jgi:hypothetical protein
MKEQRFGKINLSLTNNNYWREKVVLTLAYFVTNIMFVTYTSSIFILFNISL